MNVFEKLILKDHFVFKDLEWEMNRYRLSTIRGMNFDRADGSGNATGKSLLPSALATILNDAPPSSIKKKSSKEGMSPKSDLTLQFSNPNGSYSIRQFMHNKSVKLELFEGKTDLRLKNIGDIRNEIKQVLPLTEETLYSQVYISSLRPPTMFNGKSADRLSYFEHVFNMRIYDMLKKRWSKKITDLGKVSSVHKELLTQKSSLAEYVDKKAAKKLQSIKNRHADLMTRYKTTNLDIQQLISLTTLLDQIEGEATEKSIKKDILSLKTDISSKKSAIKAVRKLHAAYEAYEEAKTQQAKIIKKIRDIDLPEIKNAKSMLKKAYEARHGLEGQLESFEAFKDEVEELNAAKKLSDKSIKQSSKEIQAKLAKIEVEISHLSKLKSGEPCPLCNHPVSKSHNHNLSELKISAKMLEKALVAADANETVEKLIKKIPRSIRAGQITVFEKELKKVEKEVAELEEYIVASQKREALKDQLKDFNLPEKVKKPDTDTDALEDEVEKLTRSLEKKENELRVLDKISSLDTTISAKEARKALKAKQAWIKEISPHIEEFSEQIDRLTTSAARSQSSIEQIREIDKKLEDMEDRLSKRSIYEELVKACSTKGVILVETKSLAQAYIDKVNLIAKGVFLEPIDFSVDVDTNRFDIIAARSGAIGDIRSLCGSERGQFLPISGLALMSLMPSDQRSNLMIMDELDGNFSVPERKIFAEHFIPRISETIPNTVVITPKNITELSIPNSEELMLIRKNKVTSWGG